MIFLWFSYGFPIFPSVFPWPSGAGLLGHLLLQRAAFQLKRLRTAVLHLARWRNQGGMGHREIMAWLLLVQRLILMGFDGI